MKKLNALFLILTLTLVSCVSKDQIKKTIVENPDILTDAIKKNPSTFITALNEAVKASQSDMAKKREEEEKKKMEDAINKPLKPMIRETGARGTKGAPITLIEYSDFECPYCSRGFNTVITLLEKYKGKIQFFYKHLPLSFHPNAMPASRYYEALRLQSEEKAQKFHDEIYKKQKQLKNGEPFLKKLANSIGADMTKLATDVKSKAVQKIIDEDMAEAAKFGFQGTPGFLLNGIPVKGAYPVDYFEGLINKLKEKGKISI